MRLSEIKGDRCFEVLSDLVDPVSILAQDATVKELFRREKAPDGVDPADAFIQRLRKALPTLLKEHRREFVTILAAVNGQTEKEYKANMTLPSLLSDAFGVLTDPEILAFLS